MHFGLFRVYASACVSIGPEVGHVPQCTRYGDGDGYSTCDGDCDDFDANLYPADLDFDGYGLVDGSMAYRTRAGKFSLGIENLLDKDYFTYYSQSARVSDEYYFQGRGRTVTLGYQLDF